MRTGTQVTLAVVSIDGRANPTPEDLYELSKLLQAHLRETDLIGWYAGNAVATLLPDTDEEMAEKCVERIRAQLTHLALSFKVIAYAKAPSFFGGGPPAAAVELHYEDGFRLRPSKTQAALKRLLDICGSLAGIILLSPVMVAAAIAVKTTSKGPIIFKQVRLGAGGRPFTFLKFRSMRADADQNLHREHVKKLITSDDQGESGDGERPWFKMEGDPRITPVGQFLRRTSIDELPQLFNVLRGDMSLVGPRPPIPYEVESYSAWHLRRILEVKPGITGLWQTEGRGVITFEDMVRLDIRYARHWTVLMDIRILLKTVKVVLERRGAA
jgi:exopolysaccharide biosynthesis polyprenyl glycosylphosphotransferase